MNNYAKETIGKRVKDCRERFRLSQVDFLKKLSRQYGAGVSVSALSKIENGLSYPPTELLLAIDRAKIATPDQILFGEGRLPVWGLGEAVNRLTEDDFEHFLVHCWLIASDAPIDPAMLSDEARLEMRHTGDEKKEKASKISDVSRRLRWIRKSFGLGQERFARLLSLDKNTVSLHERSDDLPDMKYLLAVCTTFGTSADYILGTSEALPNRLLRVQASLDEHPFATQQLLVKQLFDFLAKKH